jgi:hypothetical protein
MHVQHRHPNAGGSRSLHQALPLQVQHSDPRFGT